MLTERRRGVCRSETCAGAITTWLQRTIRARFGTKLLAECQDCGRRIAQ